MVNRDPTREPTKWYGGDHVHLMGYVDGLNRLGVPCAFRPSWDARYDDCDIVHSFHVQECFPWAVEATKCVEEGKRLVVSAITHGHPARSEVERVVKAASRVLCYSLLEEEFYANLFPEESRDKFITVPLGVPSEIYDQSEPVSPTFSVFMAGRYCSVKNQLAVLQACKRLDVPVTFAGMMDNGAGEYLMKLRQEVGDWRGVRFLGTLKGEALWRRYRAAHVHAQPTQPWEPFGLCNLEALACGCNIVHTSRSWARDFFGQFGTVCEPDAEHLFTAIQTQLRLPRNHANWHPPTWQQASRALLPIYREALA